MIKFRPKTVKPVKTEQPKKESAAAETAQPAPSPKVDADKKAS